MEARRLEGVFLEYAIDRHRAAEAYQSSQNIAIRIRTQVPEVLLSLMGNTGSQLRAVVKESSGDKILLRLDNGYEILADNKLRVPVNSGDRITLRVESREPLTLRVENLMGGVKETEVVRNLLRAENTLLNLASSVKESLQNSGVIYEKKVLDFLLGRIDARELSKDQKFQLLKALEGLNLERFIKTLRENIPAGDTALRNLLQAMEVALRDKDYVKFMNTVREAGKYIEHRIKTLQESLASIPKEVALLKGISDRPVEGLRRLIDALPLQEKQPLLNLFERIVKGIATGGEVRTFENLLAKALPKVITSEEAVKGFIGDLPKGVAETPVSSSQQNLKFPEPLRAFREVIVDALRLVSSEKKPPKEVVHSFVSNVKGLLESLPQVSGKERILKELSIIQQGSPREETARVVQRVLSGLQSLLSEPSNSPPQLGSPAREVLSQVNRLIQHTAPNLNGETTARLIEILREFPEPREKLNSVLNTLREEPALKEAITRLADALKEINTSIRQQSADRLEIQLREIVNHLQEKKSKELVENEKELGTLSRSRESLEALPKEVIKNVEKLDLIYQLQSFMVNAKGSKFFIPILIKERWKGVFALSKREDMFRIFININLEGGFLGILMEAPKQSFPEYVNLEFRTDVDEIESLINLRKDSLRKEIESLGLEVKKLSVESSSRRDFEESMVEEFGSSIFYMKV